jgi:CheY-like chemotaxis protein
MTCILVIDDDPELRSVVREMLEGGGYAVLEASDGHAGVQICQTNALDLVITDLLMPEHDGYATIRTLRTVCPHAKIIAISGAGPIGQRDMLAFAAFAGADRTLAKPVRRADLLAAVQELLRAP